MDRSFDASLEFGAELELLHMRRSVALEKSLVQVSPMPTGCTPGNISSPSTCGQLEKHGMQPMVGNG
jgi:hypothetical protein